MKPTSDFPYVDKIASNDANDFSYVDEFLKNAFPTAFTTTDLDFVDMLNVEQPTTFSVTTSTPTSTSVGSAATFHRSSSSSQSALSMGTF